jgi:hypothetical protein
MCKTIKFSMKFFPILSYLPVFDRNISSPVTMSDGFTKQQTELFHCWATDSQTPLKEELLKSALDTCGLCRFLCDWLKNYYNWVIWDDKTPYGTLIKNVCQSSWVVECINYGLYVRQIVVRLFAGYDTFLSSKVSRPAVGAPRPPTLNGTKDLGLWAWSWPLIFMYSRVKNT